MNIFVTDLNPIIAAQNLCDKRIRHMPKECIEMLSIYVHSLIGRWITPFPLWGNDERNEPRFLYDHPVSKWVRKDKANTWWLYRHLEAMLAENTHRFDELPSVSVYMKDITPFISVMNTEPLGFQNSSLNKNLPVVTAYRETMIHKWFVTDKIKPVKWTKRNPPYWINQQQKLEL